MTRRAFENRFQAGFAATGIGLRGFDFYLCCVRYIFFCYAKVRISSSVVQLGVLS